MVDSANKQGLTTLFLATVIALLATAGCIFDQSGRRLPPDASVQQDSDVPPDSDVPLDSDVPPDSEIPPDCGDGQLQSGEECDGVDYGGRNCGTYGHSTGELACTAACMIDSTGCHTCSDGNVDGPEQCDGANLNGADCVSRGHLWGSLSCGGTCQFIETGCFDYPENWYDLNCPYRKSITVDPAQVDAPLTDYPLLIKRLDTDLRDRAQIDGLDIHFANEDGTTQLDHELERWSVATGAIVAWIGLPAVSNSLPTTIYMYYGDPSCGTPPNPAAVWDAHHRAVYHLRQTGTVDRLDSTANGRHATTAGYEGDEGVPGRHAGADYFDGNDDRLVLPSSATSGLWDFTVCFWIKTTETGSNSTDWKNPTILGNITSGWESGDFGILSENGYIGIRSGLCATPDELVISSTFIADDLWHYVCAVNVNSQITLSVDLVNATQVCSGGRAMEPLGWWIGGESGENPSSEAGFHHSGIIDEVRISELARPPTWVSANHRNQLTPGTFYFVDLEEELP